MTEQYAGALLYLVPVVVAAVVAFVVTRPAKDEAPAPLPVAPPTPSRVPAQRSAAPVVNRRMPSPPPTLLHAALSSHLAAVSGAPAPAPGSAPVPAVRPARLVSIRRPARIPRRPIHRCPHKP
ncbi:hypothetical protein ACFFX1_12180 [Dactylosporangium sucinum]|uniref:Uncharacterized protein n=1 Tax=Dactylosporangium sucinum TaxID=1424081 RepID=A0A917TYT6_9ACTN|nr:hypothetical protein [Dactylosporangium sucinum]GGM42235.1 hypothetical protein GCM10007977_049710 [Dactylosporangium sucinum]